MSFIWFVKLVIDFLFIFFPKLCLITTCTIRHYRNEKGNWAEMRPAIGARRSAIGQFFSFSSSQSHKSLRKLTRPSSLLVSKVTNNWIPWVPEVFFACGGNFRCWSKADTSSVVGRSREKKRFARFTIKTWQKLETALEMSLAPGVRTEWHGRNSV